MRSLKPQTHHSRVGEQFPPLLRWGLWLFLLLPLGLISCQEIRTGSEEEIPVVEIKLPPGIPEIPIEEGNELTQQRVDLGKRLFYDVNLSRDSSVACGSCHNQKKAFSDYSPISLGVEGRAGKRNATALFNLAWHESFNHDGGVFTLETQMLVPIEDELEMDIRLPELVDRLELDSEYVALFEEAYPDRGVTPYSVTRALGAFERTLISLNSPYDRYTYYGESDALSPSQKRGMELFFSDRLKCATCHEGFNFRKEGFESNGLYQKYRDEGRKGVTFKPEDRGKFKVPSLRNVEKTAPYMHDGSIWTLEEVVDHYASGGKAHPNKSPLITGFEISKEEKNDLINFLMALTDQSFLTNTDFAL